MYYVATKYGFIVSISPQYSVNGVHRFECSADMRKAIPFASWKQADLFALKNFSQTYFAVVKA